jgi:exosortase O
VSSDTLTPSIERSTILARPARLAMNAVILGLWLWLYRPVFDYLAIIFSREDFRTNQLVLLGVIILVAFQMRKGHLRPRLDARPQLYLPALTLVLGGSALYLVVERFLDINTLSASLFGLASYGLLGLWMQPRRWRQGLPAAVLLIGTLPFGEHMQTFVGYPMRIWTANIVRDGLARAGVASLGVDTILIFENGVSQVDLPCSGVKSLWTGLLFLVAATWIERRPLNLRWVLTALVLAGLLFVANLARVAVLVTVGQVAGWQLMARMLHVPLGVLGFCAACARRPVLPEANPWPHPPLRPSTRRSSSLSR